MFASFSVEQLQALADALSAGIVKAATRGTTEIALPGGGTVRYQSIADMTAALEAVNKLILAASDAGEPTIPRVTLATWARC